MNLTISPNANVFWHDPHVSMSCTVVWSVESESAANKERHKSMRMWILFVGKIMAFLVKLRTKSTEMDEWRKKIENVRQRATESELASKWEKKSNQLDYPLAVSVTTGWDALNASRGNKISSERRNTWTYLPKHTTAMPRRRSEFRLECCLQINCLNFFHFHSSSSTSSSSSAESFIPYHSPTTLHPRSPHFIPRPNT